MHKRSPRIKYETEGGRTFLLLLVLEPGTLLLLSLDSMDLRIFLRMH